MARKLPELQYIILCGTKFTINNKNPYRIKDEVRP